MNLLKNHWKKILFATIPLGYGVNYVSFNYRAYNHMKEVCEEVINTTNKNSPPKNVLVIMNPTANKKKAEDMFKKYCEPILHLAGYSVEIFKTSYVGHAKVYLENLENLPDAIVIAGGDGTSSEVITGLMRRRDATCPIALLALGRKSESALKYAAFKPENKLDNIKCLTNALMPMITDKVRRESVLRFDIDAEDPVEQAKPIFGLSQFSWGLLRDIDSMKDKYWYFGYLRHKAAALFNSFSKDLDWKWQTKFEYTPPCAGCTTCFPENNNTPPVSNSYFRKIFTEKTKVADKRPFTENANCNKSVEGSLTTSQLSVGCKRNDDSFYELETKCIDNLNPGLDFIKNISEVTNYTVKPSVTLRSRTIKLFPEEKKENKFFYIDGEEYNVQPIKITLVPDAINLFCY